MQFSGRLPIKQGDTDIHQILELIKTDPTKDWISTPVQEKQKPAEVSFEGIKIRPS